MNAFTWHMRRTTNAARTLGVVTYADSDTARPLTPAEAQRYVADASTWWHAVSLRSLSQLTADWLEGANLFLPAYLAASPDPETRDLIPTLVDANRAGFMTACSQPGHEPTEGYDGWMWSQLAAVTGFCGLDTVASLQDAIQDIDGLHFYAWAPGTQFARRPHAEQRIELFEIPATIRENPATGETWLNTVFGPPRSRRELRQTYRGDLNRDAIKTLQNTWQVTIAETEYGRNDRLWPLLEHWAKVRLGLATPHTNVIRDGLGRGWQLDPATDGAASCVTPPARPASASCWRSGRPSPP